MEAERDLGGVLARELDSTDCVVVVGIRNPTLGDIDCVVVGPGGVTVIDQRRRSGRDVSKIRRQRIAVRLALGNARPELRNVSVAAVLCLPRGEHHPAQSLQHGVTVAGARETARLAQRGGELTPADIDDIAHILRGHLPAVTRAHIDGQFTLTGTPAPGAHLETRRRVSARTRRLCGLAAAVLALAICLTLVLYIEANAVGEETPALTITRQGGRSVVYLTAPDAGDRVRLRVRADRSVHAKLLIAQRAGIRWQVPRSWAPTLPITVSACVVDPTGRCISPTATATGTDASAASP